MSNSSCCSIWNGKGTTIGAVSTKVSYWVFMSSLFKKTGSTTTDPLPLSCPYQSFKFSFAKPKTMVLDLLRVRWLYIPPSSPLIHFTGHRTFSWLYHYWGLCCIGISHSGGLLVFDLFPACFLRPVHHYFSSCKGYGGCPRLPTAQSHLEYS